MTKMLGALAFVLLTGLAACGDLPPGRVPVQPTAQQGGGAAYLNAVSKPAVP